MHPKTKRHVEVVSLLASAASLKTRPLFLSIISLLVVLAADKKQKQSQLFFCVSEGIRAHGSNMSLVSLKRTNLIVSQHLPMFSFADRMCTTTPITRWRRDDNPGTHPPTWKLKLYFAGRFRDTWGFNGFGNCSNGCYTCQWNRLAISLSHSGAISIFRDMAFLLLHSLEIFMAVLEILSGCLDYVGRTRQTGSSPSLSLGNNQINQ